MSDEAHVHIYISLCILAMVLLKINLMLRFPEHHS